MQRGEPTPADVVVATIGKPFGLRGEVYLWVDPDLDPDLSPGARYATDRGGELVVAGWREHSGRLLVAFEGVADRTAAERLRGVRLRAPRESLPLEEGAFWVDELLGREVVDEHGALIGVLEAVTESPAHDYLVVARPDGGELLVPAHEDFVDLGADPIVVRPIEGLLE